MRPRRLDRFLACASSIAGLTSILWFPQSASYSMPTRFSDGLVPGQAHSLVLVTGDFNEDGVMDVVAGFSVAGNGIVTFRGGNADALPTVDPHSLLDIPPAQHVPPFLSGTALHVLPDVPEFLVAGDFDLDGHLDLITASRTSTKMYLHPGDGKGGFLAQRTIELPGTTTALISGEVNRADGVTDLVVGTISRDGPRVLVFESAAGALNAPPTIVEVPAPATAFALGRFRGGFFVDLAIAAGQNLVLVPGNDQTSWDVRSPDEDGERVVTRRFASPIASLAVGHFFENTTLALAALCKDGSISVLEPIRRTGKEALSAAPGHVEEWRTRATIVTSAGSQSSLVPLRDPLGASTDLMVVDGAARRLMLLTSPTDAARTLDLPTEPVAVVPFDSRRLLLMRDLGDSLEVVTMLPESTRRDWADVPPASVAPSVGSAGLRGTSDVATQHIQDGVVDAYSYRLRHAGTTIEIITSKLGAVARGYDDSSPTPLTPTRAVVTRYSDNAVFGLDYASATFSANSLDNELAKEQAELQMVHAWTIPGSGPAPLPNTPGLERAGIERTIEGIKCHGFLFNDALGKTWRLFFADKLPRPPARIRRKMLTTPQGGSDPSNSERDEDDCDDQPSATPAEQIAGRALLRVELQVGSDWNVVYHCESVRKVRVSQSAFGPPAGWAAGTPDRINAEDQIFRKGVVSTGPGTSTESTAGISVPGNLGFVSNHPDVYPFFWGDTFADPDHSFVVNQLYRAFFSLNSPSYNSFLGLYGVGSGQPGDLQIRSGNPPSYANDGIGMGVAAASFVTDRMADGSGPLFWATCCSGPHDPIYAVMIPEAVVGHPEHSGVHIMVPLFLRDLIPWPFNLFLHQGMPFMVVKVPEDAMSLNCDPHLRLTPGGCPQSGDRDAFDTATHNISHEFVEAATDPFPLFSNAFPDADCGEIGDICDLARCYPDLHVASNVLVDNTFVFTTYWSNALQTCVPAVTAEVRINSPAQDAVIPWVAGGPRVVADASASDPINGDVSQAIEWQLDGVVSARGQTFRTPPLAPGLHNIVACIWSSDARQPGPFCADVRVHVLDAAPPMTRILHPVDGHTYGTDQVITFRGEALDPQDGYLPGSSFTWYFDGVPFPIHSEAVTAHFATERDVSIRLTATNSEGQSSDATITIHVGPAQGAPSIQLNTPVNHAGYSPGDVLTFTATAKDVTGAPLADANIEWRVLADPACDPLGPCVESFGLGIGSSLVAAMPLVIGQVRTVVIGTDPVRGTKEYDLVYMDSIIPRPAGLVWSDLSSAEGGQRLTPGAFVSTRPKFTLQFVDMDEPDLAKSVITIDARELRGDELKLTTSGGSLRQIMFSPALDEGLHVLRARIVSATGQVRIETDLSVTAAAELRLIAPRVEPNPSRGVLRVDFEMTRAADYTFDVYDLGGRRIYSVGPARGRSGANHLDWNNATGNQVLENGIYYYVLAARSQSGRTRYRGQFVMLR